MPGDAARTCSEATCGRGISLNSSRVSSPLLILRSAPKRAGSLPSPPDRNVAEGHDTQLPALRPALLLLAVHEDGTPSSPVATTSVPAFTSDFTNAVSIGAAPNVTTIFFASLPSPIMRS